MLIDALNRSLSELRISVTDRCNFRCGYCMPSDEYERVKRTEILTFEEITRLAKIFVRAGVGKIHLTGGEPLLRKGVEKLVKQLSFIDGLKDLSLTTNGFLLAEKAPVLKSAGLARINVSLDSLDPEKFRRATRSGELYKVLAGLFAAKVVGLHPIKINVVVVRGFNDDEIINLICFSRANGFSIRFIEYMDAGNSNGWHSDKMVSKHEIIQRIHNRFPLREIKRNGSTAPAVGYQFLDGIGNVGVIAAVTDPFCSSCVRARLTVDGQLVTCLFSENGYDLKKMMRAGCSDAEIRSCIDTVWKSRRARYSQERLEAMNSVEGYRPEDHTKIEMITLGG